MIHAQYFALINLNYNFNAVLKPVSPSFLFSLIQTAVGGTASAESMRNKRRVVSLVTLVTAMFALSWLPIQLILLLKSIGMYKVTIFNISIQVGVGKAVKKGQSRFLEISLTGLAHLCIQVEMTLLC